MSEITSERLSELEALLAKATPGPWERESQRTSRMMACCQEVRGPKNELLFESSNSETVVVDQDETGEWDVGSIPNYELVCALRNSAPALIALARKTSLYEKALREIASRRESWGIGGRDDGYEDGVKGGINLMCDIADKALTPPATPEART